MDRYDKRSNVESVFSAIKRKFGDGRRSRTDVAMRNKTYANLVCHNLCCVIQSQIELGILAGVLVGEAGRCCCRDLTCTTETVK